MKNHPMILEEDILVMILTVIPEDKLCYKLDKQLEEILRKENNALIKEKFPFHPQYLDSRILRESLMNLKLGRGIIGCSDQTFRINPILYDKAKLMEKNFSKQEIKYLKSLGKKLEYRK